jgi:hypothetical protein
MMMRDSGDSFLDDHVRKVVSSPPPPHAEKLLRLRLEEFRSRVKALESGLVFRSRGRDKSKLWGLIATCAAAAILLAVIGVILRPHTSFAEVAAAALEQPWVHERMVETDGFVGELWYSPAKEIMAWRGRDSIQYEDYRLQVYYTYIPGEQILYRGPVVWRSRADEFESMAMCLRALFQHDRPAAQPLSHLGSLGPDREMMKVVDQGMEKVVDQGRTWLDYRLKVNDLKLGHPVQMLFRVDASTKLPQLSRIEGVLEGKPVAVETWYDYPEKGPADIYDLGVPRTAKLIDRVPAGDLKRILETLRAGRDRMDDYKAVFVQHLPGIKAAWWTDLPIVFYRKGRKLRADYVGGWQGDLSATKRPADGVDLGKWWFERVKFFQFYPQYVVRDSTMFTAQTKYATDPDGKRHMEIDSVLRTESRNNPGEDFPPEWSMRPEFTCRPPMGIGGQQFEPVIDEQPTSGPPGCILLRVRHTSAKERINEQGRGIPDADRYWLDPKRDYIAMRWDMVMQGENGQDSIFESDVTEETARSPQGVWYATRIRRTFPSRVGKDKFLDQVYHIYVDFSADLPDSLFEPPTPRKVY